ncbi:hypothetical protein AB0E77_21440 [Streptomyces sp. NPDC032940]|uniref:hypothetical protein n=1 Tax=Streptomyces sp. NPDC032940 TaxID=3155366 RepID=UPI0033DEBFFA
MATVTFRDETPTGKRLAERELTGLPGRMTVRELIALRSGQDTPALSERTFLTNGFFILTDDRQLDSLDETVDLTGSPTLTFIKLVALAGG